MNGSKEQEITGERVTVENVSKSRQKISMWADNSEKENNDDKKVEYNNKLHDFGTILYCFYVSIKNSIDTVVVLTYVLLMSCVHQKYTNPGNFNE